MQNAFLTLAGIIMVASTTAVGAGLPELDIPLTVTEVAGVNRVAEPCSTGVPLPVGMLKRPKGIALFNGEGKAVPAQFAVLEHWREFGWDGSIKWLLVTFLADVPKGGAAVYRLKAGANPAPAKPAEDQRGGESPIAEKGDRGPLFPFRLQLTRPDGTKVSDAELDKPTKEIVETGPVRRCVRYETPTSHEKFGFIAWVYTYAGLTRTDLTVVLKNTPDELKGPFYFKDFSAVVDCRGPAGEDRYLLGGEPGKATAGTLAEKQSVYLYQDSDGTDRWDKLGRRRDGWAAYVLDWSKEKTLLKLGTPQFRGYRVTAGEKKLGEGNYALGWAALSRGGRTAVLAVRHFRENYPSAVEVRPGRIVAGLLPKYFKGHRGLHWLDDSQRKRFDVSLRLIDGKLEPTDGDAAALSFNRPLVAHAGLDWLRRTGAVGLIAADARLGRSIGPKPHPHDYGAEPNWVTFGGDTSDRIRRRYHQYSMSRFVRSGNPWDAYRVMIGAYHSSGMTPLWLDDYQYPRDKNKLTVRQYCSTARKVGKYRDGTGHHGYKTWNMAHFTCAELFDAWRLFGDPLALDAVRDVATYLRFYADYRHAGGASVAGTRSDGHPLTNLAEAYRLTGDRGIFTSLEKLAAVSWKQVNKIRGNYGVMSSWEGGKDLCEKPFMMSQVMDGLAGYYSLTHNETTRDQILGMVDFILAEAHLGEWGYTYVVKLASGKAQAEFRESAIAAVRKNPGAFRMQLNPRHLLFAYRQTGEARYRDAFLNLLPAAYRAHGNNKARYAPLVAAFREPRADATRPADVVNLDARALGRGKARLSWTAPAGDPVRYQVKWAGKPIVERLDRPKQATGAIGWWAAENVPGEPAPTAAGTKQSMTVEKVPPGTRYFAIRSFDAASNRTALSNAAKVRVR